MILKKQEKDNVIKAMYSSSTILASIYDKEKQDLTVIFNKGGQYKYIGVPSTDYTRFEIADSQGIILNSHIKKYTFEKLADVNPDAIVKEIDALKVAERNVLLKAKQDAIVTSMKELIVINDTLDTNLFTELQLTTLQTNITNYLVEFNKK